MPWPARNQHIVRKTGCPASRSRRGPPPITARCGPHSPCTVDSMKAPAASCQTTAQNPAKSSATVAVSTGRSMPLPAEQASQPGWRQWLQGQTWGGTNRHNLHKCQAGQAQLELLPANVSLTCARSSAWQPPRTESGRPGGRHSPRRPGTQLPSVHMSMRPRQVDCCPGSSHHLHAEPTSSHCDGVGTRCIARKGPVACKCMHVVAGGTVSWCGPGCSAAQHSHLAATPHLEGWVCVWGQRWSGIVRPAPPPQTAAALPGW